MKAENQRDRRKVSIIKRKQYDSQFKATVALEAVKNQKTIAQIASEYGIHPNQVGKWKKQLLQVLPQVFTNRQTSSEKANDKLICAVLYDAKHRKPSAPTNFIVKLVS